MTPTSSAWCGSLTEYTRYFMPLCFCQGKTVGACTMRALIALCLFICIARAITIDQTAVLWMLCVGDAECRSLYSIEQGYEVPSIITEDTLHDSQFHAFHTVVSIACARRDQGECFSDALQALIHASLGPTLSETSLVSDLWLARIKLWIATSGQFCGANRIAVVDSERGVVTCQCMLNKDCGDQDSVFSDSVFIQVLIVILLVVEVFQMLHALYVYIRMRTSHSFPGIADWRRLAPPALHTAVYPIGAQQLSSSTSRLGGDSSSLAEYRTDPSVRETAVGALRSGAAVVGAKRVDRVKACGSVSDIVVGKKMNGTSLRPTAPQSEHR